MAENKCFNLLIFDCKKMVSFDFQVRFTDWDNG